MRKLCFITFLTLVLASCKDNTETKIPVVSDAGNFETRIIPVEPALAIAWVDQLRIRTLPDVESRVIRELSEGDTLFYLNERTFETNQLTLRDSIFDQPWLKVRLTNGQEGWVFGGGIKLIQH